MKPSNNTPKQKTGLQKNRTLYNYYKTKTRHTQTLVVKKY